MNMKGLHMAAIMLVIVGAINWGLVGLLNLNLVHMILGSMAVLENIVYIAVGLAGIMLLLQHKSDCKICSAK